MVEQRLRHADVYLPIRPMSKARPRLAAGKAPYHDRVYREWKDRCRALMGEWWTDPPLKHVNCLIAHFYGPAQGDLDNRLGSVLDAGNGLIWTDDNVKVIGRCAMRWIHDKPIKSRIYLKLIWTEEA